MKKTSRLVRYLFGSMMAVVGTFMLPHLTHGQDISAGNSTTGADSDNTADVSIDSSNCVDVHNDADIHNNIDVSANTGGNTASKNTGDGSVSTGDAQVSARVINSVNKVGLSGNGSGSSLGSVDVLNHRTGAESDNHATVEFENRNDINIRNNADINNDIRGRAETSDNEASKNTGDGSVETGDATFDATTETSANMVSLDLGEGSGDTNVDLSNEQTGYNSDNKVKFDLENKNKLYVNNDADIWNGLDIKTDTGDNEASKNTGDGSVETGDAESNLTVMSSVNMSEINMGTGSGNIDVTAANDTTGADSDNRVYIDVEKESEIKIDNDADINNCIEVKSKTGDNEASKNTGDGSVETGDATADFDILTKANTASLESTSGEGDVSIDAQNYRTGYDSDNKIDVDLEMEKNINVDNNLNVDNNIDVRAETGDNEASKNTGDGSVNSGDINVSGSIENIGNMVEVGEINGNGDMDISAFNDTTGADSDNLVKIDLENENELKIDNDTDVDNDVQVKAETGNNESDKNTGDGEAMSGDVNIDLSAETSGGIVGSGEVSSEMNQLSKSIENDLNKVLSGEGKFSVSINGDDIA